MNKIVNIYPTTPITGVNPPIRSMVRHITKSVNDIRTCIIARAIVEEVLPSGCTILLDLSNYDKDTSIIEQCDCGCCDQDNIEEVIEIEEAVSDDEIFPKPKEKSKHFPVDNKNKHKITPSEKDEIPKYYTLKDKTMSMSRKYKK